MDKPSPNAGGSVPPKPEKKPWPMWPIALSILCFIVFYTWVQLNFRKPGQPYEPNQAMKERIERAAEKNLYDWYSLPVARTNYEGELAPLDATAKPFTALENELPSQIVYYLPRKPILVPRLTQIWRLPNRAPGEPVQIGIRLPSAIATHPDFHLTALYKEKQLILLPEIRIESEESLPSLGADSPEENVFFEIGSEPIGDTSPETSLYSAGTVWTWN